MSGAVDDAIKTFRQEGGTLRMKQALDRGLSRYMLYKLLDEGIIERLSRGLYRLTERNAMSRPDIVMVSLRYPHAVICLISALSFHEMTTQIPRAVHVAVPRHVRLPDSEYPPVQSYRFSEDAYEAGIDEHRIDETVVKVYSQEKTLADCFKYRNKIGLDVALEGLRMYASQRNVRTALLMKYARICRVEKVMKPYLESLMHV